jgi:hypothetical protein
MRLPRIRLRTLMIAVAAIGLSIGGTIEAVRLVRLSRSYSDRAASHAAYDRGWRAMADEYGADYRLPTHDARTISLREVTDFHVKLRLKYERAARYPWLPVEPDPPEPE